METEAGKYSSWKGNILLWNTHLGLICSRVATTYMNTPWDNVFSAVSGIQAKSSKFLKYKNPGVCQYNVKTTHNHSLQLYYMHLEKQHPTLLYSQCHITNFLPFFLYSQGKKPLCPLYKKPGERVWSVSKGQEYKEYFLMITVIQPDMERSEILDGAGKRQAALKMSRRAG